jgi:hypothetical protein
MVTMVAIIILVCDVFALPAAALAYHNSLSVPDPMCWVLATLFGYDR